MRILQLFSESPLVALAFLLALVVAITVHECAHAWTAYRLGDDTPYLQGRVTLNPLAHLDPLGSLLFLLLGFGWGKPVLYNPMRLSRRVDELVVALAGPASNIILAILLNILVTLSTHGYLPFLNPLFLQIGADINVLLAAFNMIPIPPLDGSSIVAYFWPEYRSMAGGQIGFVILLVLIFFPVGGGNLLTGILSPIITLFTHLTTLGGLIG